MANAAIANDLDQELCSELVEPKQTGAHGKNTLFCEINLLNWHRAYPGTNP